jgi:hypothetical protein
MKDKTLREIFEEDFKNRKPISPEEEKRLNEEMIEEEAKTWEKMRKEIPFIK